VKKLPRLKLLSHVASTEIESKPVMVNLLQTECLNGNPKLTYVFQSANMAV